MREKSESRGKVFNFKPEEEWSHGNAQPGNFAEVHQSHMVVIPGNLLRRPPGWVKIATVSIHPALIPELSKFGQITSTSPQDFDKDHYLPICPTKRD